mgnify:FL=1
MDDRRSNKDPAEGKELFKFLWRGITKACPLCGQRKLFKKWVHMERNCPRCRLYFERIEGHWIGAVGINTIVSFLLLVGGLAIFFYVTYPDIPTGKWVFWFAACFGAFPILFYPNSKTLWTAIDILMRPIEEKDFKTPETDDFVNTLEDPPSEVGENL